VTDKAGSFLDEGDVAENVVGMAVRVDDVADRPVGPGTNRGKQLLRLTNASAGVDHRNCAVADDETDIGGRASVLACHQRGRAAVHEDAGRNFVNGQLLLRHCEGWRAEQRQCNQEPNAASHISASVSSRSGLDNVMRRRRGWFASQHASEDYPVARCNCEA
jgi:hypothetical protein